MSKVVGPGSQTPEDHDIIKLIAADDLLQGEQQKPLDNEGAVIQNHKTDIHEEGDTVGHFSHNIILYG